MSDQLLSDGSGDAPLRVGFIGFGGHVTKNILARFVGHPGREIAAILVRDVERYAQAHPAQAHLFTDDLAAMLADASVEVIYIATPIATHFDYAMAALAAGKHVWCEKPLTGRLDQTLALCQEAAARGLFLGEVMVYAHHLQFAGLRAEIAARLEAGERIIDARARFSIPDLKPTDIRYQRAMGGGALLDVGYYPLSLASALFGAPQAVQACGHLSDQYNVDISGSAFLSYGDFAFHGLWAIGSAYANELEISFSRSTLRVDRVFSKPADLATRIDRITNFGQPGEPLAIPADDQFDNMFAQFAAQVRQADAQVWQNERDAVIARARIMDAVMNWIDPAAAK